jgi:vancomycin permeability regulator SanA
MAARIFAVFIALLALTNLLGNLLWPGFDSSIWWISFGALPEWFSETVLAFSGIILLAFALRSPDRSRRSKLTAGVALFLACVAAANTVGFYWMLARGQITAGFPVPFSLLIFAGMIAVARTSWFPREDSRRFGIWPIAAGGVLLFAAFPLGLMLFFGNTDYRRPADAAVVFGARAYANGRLSDALEDRIRTACELYRAGLVKRLVLSGGPGDGPITEATAMRGYALSHGVRAEDIFLDDNGLNTAATVRNTTTLFQKWQAHRILVVSHFYHLPRIKLAYQRAGIEVCTVPARQAHWLGQIPYSMAREVAAFWSYFLKERPVAQIRTSRAA